MISTTTGEGGGFPLTKGLHQGSSLKPYLFSLIVDELIRKIQDDPAGNIVS